ncbi:MAG: hypothetical protein ABSB49_16465 [Polyangia bacterium]|jgi:hypothetical protein
MSKSLLVLLGSLLVYGCGGSSSGTSTDSGTAGAAGTVGGGGTSGSTGSCDIACLNQVGNLADSCQPSGTCTSQVSVSGTSASEAFCYGNGVKMSVSGASMSTTGTGNTSLTMTVKNGATVCYSAVISTDSTGAGTIDFKNASGAEVATITSSATGAETVTCPGQAATAIDSSCEGASNSLNNSASSTSTSTCTTGTCSF